MQLLYLDLWDLLFIKKLKLIKKEKILVDVVVQDVALLRIVIQNDKIKNSSSLIYEELFFMIFEGDYR